MATTSAPPAAATSAELVAWAFDRINAHDVDALRQVWTADTVERFPSGTYHGTKAIAAYFKELFAAVPDVRMEVVKIAADGDDVFAHWQLTGTHEGTFEGIAATGKPVVLDGIDHFVVRDGAIVSNFVAFDQMQFARAIGLMPADGSRADRAMKGAFNARRRVQERLRRA
jgi:steroid delta-isomerase-like uncharacterized protein